MMSDGPADPRREEEAIAWAEATTGGKLVRREKQARWRPHWMLDFAMPDGTTRRTVLRGYRNPGYTEMDHSGANAFLMREAAFLEALQDVPIKLPRYYGRNPELGWMLMEFVRGDTQLTEIADEDRRFRIYAQYMDQLARLHAWPLDRIVLPSGETVPADCRSFARALYEKHNAFYRSLERRWAEPTLELGLQWVARHDVPSERPIAVGFGDVGPNQFLFDGDELTSLIDIEYAIVGDPLMEMGMMRGRDVTYHTGRMDEHMAAYGKAYERLTGIPLCKDSLAYWTIAGPVIWNPFTVAGAQAGDGEMVDYAFLCAYEVQQKICILDGLSEYYGLPRIEPELPEERGQPLDALAEALVRQFRTHYARTARDKLERDFVRYSEAMAETLRINAAMLPAIQRANLDELSELLGRRTDDFDAAMWALERLIAADPEHDLERRLAFLQRFERRRDRTYLPMQLASGVSPTIRMAPLPA